MTLHGRETDPIVGELMRSQMVATVTDMGKILSRNAASLEIIEERDFACGVVLDRGQVVAMDNLLHLGALAGSTAALQDFFEFAIKPGDVVLTNDPYGGGNHTQDFTLMTPFYHEREQVCYVAARAHLPEVGGHVRGGYFPFADDVWGEGSRITPVKIVQEGKIVGDVFDAILINSRVPDVLEVNFEAMFAALQIGVRRLAKAIEKYGPEDVVAGMHYCLHYSSSQLRSELATWPSGEWTGTAFLDHDGKGGKDLKIAVQVVQGSGQLRLDFSDSAPQSGGFVNSTRANTLSHVLVPLCALLGDEFIANSGLLNEIEVITPEGTIVNPRFPAPVGWGPAHVGAEIVAAVNDALSKFLPGRIASLHPRHVLTVARWPRRQQSFPLHTFVQGGAGACSDFDGWGAPGPFSRTTVPSVELVETQYPLRVRSLGIWPDSAGAGRQRGAFGTFAEFEFHDTTLVNVVMEDRKHRGESSARDRYGVPNRLRINGEDCKEPLLWDTDISGSMLELAIGGGVGWGDPAERAPEAERMDAENELLSR